MTKYKTGADITDLKQPDFIKLLESAVEWRLTKIGEFSIMTATHALNNDPEAIEYIIEGLLPYRSNTLFAGETGSGKSYFALEKALAIANNEDRFLGFKILKKNLKVLYVDTECGENLLHNRFKQVVKNYQPFTGEQRFFMMSKVGRQGHVWDAINTAIETFKPDILIIDCLYNTASNVRMDMAHSLSTLTDRMIDLSEKHKITIEAVHHFNKGLSEQGLVIERIQGASPLLFWAEHITGIVNTTTLPEDRLLRVMKSRKGHDPNHYYKLIWDATEHRFINEGVTHNWMQYLINSNTKKAWVAFLSAVIEVADKDGRFQTKDALNIGENHPFNKSETTINRWLKNLTDSGFLEKITHGVYKKTDLRIIDDKTLQDDDM